MHAPDSAGGVNLPADPIQALKLYSTLGFKVFPAIYADKRPGVDRWGDFANSPPVDPRMWDQFAGRGKKINVAIACDEHLVVIDIDNRDFAHWFDAQGPERLGTWIVRTQSGGLHVYVRTTEDQRTTVLKSPSGVKVGDVKARGGYVIAPPSVGPNGDYQTEYGSPDAIVRQANAITWFNDFVVAWERSQPIRLQPGMTEQAEYANDDVHGAPPPSRQDEILEGLRRAWLEGTLNRNIWHTLVEGPDHDGSKWKNPDDRSEVDFGCVKELINLGWGFPEIEELWTFSPVGDRYRTPSARGDRHSYGHGYLLRTFDNAKRVWEKQQAEMMQLVGPNWKVIGTVERWTEDGKRRFAFTLEDLTTHERFDIECEATAFLTPNAFSKVCYEVGIYPQLGNFDSKAALRDMVQKLSGLAVERQQPELATREGHLREQIRVIVQQFVLPRVLEVGEDFTIYDVWSDGRFVYVQPRRLHLLIQRTRMSPLPSEAETWRQWATLGGDNVRLGGSPWWRAPASAFALPF